MFEEILKNTNNCLFVNINKRQLSQIQNGFNQLDNIDIVITLSEPEINKIEALKDTLDIKMIEEFYYNYISLLIMEQLEEYLPNKDGFNYSEDKSKIANGNANEMSKYLYLNSTSANLNVLKRVLEMKKTISKNVRIHFILDNYAPISCQKAINTYLANQDLSVYVYTSRQDLTTYLTIDDIYIENGNHSNCNCDFKRTISRK